MKKMLKLSAVVLASIACLSGSVLADIPKNTVIVKNYAYEANYLNTHDESIMNLLDALAKGSSIFVKIDENLTLDLSGNIADKDRIPEVTYYDKNGRKSVYEAKDGKLKSSEMEDSELKVIDIN